MTSYKTAQEAMQQRENKKITLFSPVKSSTSKTMRPGKTRKDKASGAWGNRFKNQQARDEAMKDRGRRK